MDDMLITNGGLNARDPLQVADTGYEEALKRQEILKDTPLYQKLFTGAQASAVGTAAATKGLLLRQRWEEDQEVDRAWMEGQYDLIRDELPDANEAEEEALMSATNPREFYIMKEAITQARKQRELADDSGWGITGRLTMDVLPEIVIGTKGAGLINKVTTKGLTRVGAQTAFGAGFTGGYEAMRQRASLEEEDTTSVVIATVLGGVLGGAFDGLTGVERAALMDKGGDSLKRALKRGGAKTETVADDVADVAKAADDAGTAGTTKPADDVIEVSPSTKDTPTGYRAAEGSPVAPLRTRALDDLMGDAPAKVAVKADLSATVRMLTGRDEVVREIDEPVTAMAAAFKEAQQKAQEALQARQATPVAPVAPEAAVGAVRASQAPSDVPQEIVEALVGQPVKSVAEAAWEGVADVVPSVAPAITKAEAKADAAMTTGRLRIKDGDTAYKPKFESPVDRALATLGGDETAEGALRTLREAFPGQQDETLKNMAHDYLNGMLLPYLRKGGLGAPQVSRYWNNMDPERYLPTDELVAKTISPEVIQKFVDNSPVKAEGIPLDPTDADGVLRQASVEQANKWVTKQTLGSRFAFLKKNSKTASMGHSLSERVEAWALKFGGEPDLHLVRTWMAKEVYGRKLFDAQQVARQAGKQAGSAMVPKLVFLAGASVAGFVAFTPDAEAAGEGAVASGISTALTGATVLLGGKFFTKLLKNGGVTSDALRKGYSQAVRMKNKGMNEEYITAKTGFKVQDGEVVYEAPIEELKQVVDTRKLNAEWFDDLHMAAKVKTAEGTPLKSIVVFDTDATVKTLEGIGADPLKRLHVGVGKYKIQARFPKPIEGGRAHSSRVADDKSAKARGLGMLLMSSVLPRLSGKAAEMAADALYKRLHTGNLGRAYLHQQAGIKAWYAETGRKAPSIFNVQARLRDEHAFNVEVTRAKRYPDAQVSAAAKKAAGEIAKLEAEQLKRIKQLVNTMESRGIKLPDDSPLKQASKLEADPNYVSRVTNKEQWDLIEAKVGAAGIKGLLADGFRAANSGVPADKIDEIADKIYNTLSRSHDRTALFVDPNQFERLVGDMERIGLDKDTIDQVSELFGIRSAKAPGVLKARRMELDLSVSRTFKLADGSEVTYKLEDLYEQDIMALFGRWSHSMAGLEALGTAGAKHGIDLTNDTAWNAMIRAIKDDGAEEYSIQAFEGFRNLMLGRSRDTEIFGQPGALERTIRTAATFWLGSNFVIAQMGDIGGIGGRALKQLFKGVFANDLHKAIKEGRVSQEELSRLATIMDLGLDTITPTTRNMLDSGEALGANLMERGVHAQMKWNGMHFVMKAVKMAKANEIQYEMMRYVLGEEIDPRLWKHYATFGIDKAFGDRLRAFKQAHPEAVIFDADGVFKGIDGEAFREADFLLARQYEMALHKAADLANAQAAGMGMSAQFFTSNTLGRFMGQLQSTAMLITQRLERDLLNFDSMVMSAWITSMAFSAVGYMARVGMRYGNDQEELEKRLTYEQIFLASIRNSSFAGVVPNLIDAALHYSGAVPGGVFAGATNSGRNGGGELAVQAAIKTPIGAMAGIMGLFKEDNVLTQGDAFAIQRTVLPFWFLALPMAMLTQNLDKREPKKPAAEPAASPFY